MTYQFRRKEKKVRANPLCPICKCNLRVTDLKKKVAPGAMFKCPECKTSLMYFDTGKGIDVWSIEFNGIEIG